jgi:Uma2 family endonuclease
MHESVRDGERPFPRRASLEEAERLSAASDRYFEYAHGVLYAMAGGSPEHGAVLAHLFTAVSGHVGCGPCRALEGHTRLYVSEQDYYLPDVWVTCSDWPAQGRPGYHDATLVCEVVSDESADRDHDIKLVDYRRLPSLREYVLVDCSAWREGPRRALFAGGRTADTRSAPHAFHRDGLPGYACQCG